MPSVPVLLVINSNLKTAIDKKRNGPQLTLTKQLNDQDFANDIAPKPTPTNSCKRKRMLLKKKIQLKWVSQSTAKRPRFFAT